MHPVVGRLRQPRHPARFGGTPAAARRPGARRSASTPTRSCAELGLGDRIADLRAAGVVA